MRRRIPIALKIFFGFTVIILFVLLGNILFLSQLAKLNNIIQKTSSGMYRVALSQQLRGKLRQQRSSRALYNHLGRPVDRAKAENTVRQFENIISLDLKKAAKIKGDKALLESVRIGVKEFTDESRRAIRLVSDSSATSANALFSSEENKALISKLKSELAEALLKDRLEVGPNELSKTVETVDLFVKPSFYLERFTRENLEFIAGAESLAVLSATSNPVPKWLFNRSKQLDSLFRAEIESGETKTQQWDSIYTSIIDTLDNIILSELAALSTTLGESHRAVSLTRRIDTYGSILLLVFGLVFAYSIANRIASPIQRLREAANAASRGEWERRLDKTTHDEIGDLTDDFNAMLIELGKLDEMKSRFLASITHDLKSPIGRVRGNIANLQDGLLGPVSSGQAELLEMMGRDVDKLSRLIHDILDLQKMKAGAFKLDISNVEVKSFLLDSLEQHATVFLEKEIEMGVKIEFDSLSARFDPRQIDRVLDNLITNALKFSSPGGKIIIEAACEGGYLIIKVFDTGVGIPKEHLERVFGEFYQVEDRAKPAKGSGLGLAISKQIIEAHSGKIWADSRPGAGTCFAFTIPI